MKISVTFYLLQTDWPVTKIGYWLGCSQHINSNRKMFSSYTSVQGGKSSCEILLPVMWLAKEQSSFVLMKDALLLLKAFTIFLNQGTISSLLEPYMMKVFINAHMKLQAERVDNIYMSRNSEGTIGGLQLSNWRGTIGDYDGLKLGCSVLLRRQIGTRRRRRTRKSRSWLLCWSKFS